MTAQSSNRKCPACGRGFLTVDRTLKGTTLRCPACGWVQFKLRMGKAG